MCIMDYDSLEENVPRGNRTLCKLVSVKINKHTMTHKKKIYNNNEVWTVNAKDVDYIECELLNAVDHLNSLQMELSQATNSTTKSNKEHITNLKQMIKQEENKKRFKLQPRTSQAEVKCSINQFVNKSHFKAKFTQFPVNIADAITGHKLQGRTMDTVIISSWPKMAMMKNWEYTILSRVISLKGLFLFKPIDLKMSFKAPEELISFLKQLKKCENN